MAKRRKLNKRNTENKKNNNQMHYSVSASLLFLTSILTGLFIYTNSSALLAKILRNGALAIFSISAYLIPFILVLLGVYVIKTKTTKRLLLKGILALVECGLVSSLYQLLVNPKLPVEKLMSYAEKLKSGGLIGGLISNIFASLIGVPASVVIVLFAIVALLSIILKVSVISMISSFISGFKSMKKELDEVEELDSYEGGRKFAQKINNKKKYKKSVDFSIDENGEVVVSKKKKTEKSEDYAISPEELEERISEITINADELKESDDENITLGASLDDVEEIKDESSDDNSPSGNRHPKRVSSVTEEEKSQIKGEIEDSIETQKIEYVYPPINLLKKAPPASADKRREMQETATKLMEILQNFGVEAKLLQVTQGPSVTRYEIQPNTGIKLSKITGLAEDIALNLAVPTVLVAAVPGKAAVGIEVPNTSVNTVSVRELLESTKFTQATSKLTVALGKDIGGNVVVGDIAKMPHVLIAGSTGSGKSVCINTIITSILYKASPDEVKLIMVDPKVVELGVYNGIPHLLIPVVTDPKRAAGALNWAVGEMMRRYSLFAETGSRNLAGYNELMEKNSQAKLPQIVIIIDELADLMMVAAKEVEDYVCRLAQLARAAGIHLIIATQRPSVDVITGLIKANVPSRIAFAVSSQVDSRTILDKGGAEKLLGKGDMLYHPTGLSTALRVQGAFVSDNEIENIVTFIKENSEVTHYSEDLADHLDRLASGDVATEESKDDDDADELLPEAIELAVELGQISTAMIQRRLKVGYARAGRIIDQMEARGIISGANGSKPREVYMNRINGMDLE